jgi:surfeit locus 1 family protein
VPDRPHPLHPRYWAIHLVALACVAAAVGLGYWQYDAWQLKRESAARDVSRIPSLPLTKVVGPDDPFPGKYVGQPVTLTGTWEPGGTIMISGRERNGVEGYWVVTPLEVGPGTAELMVVRGWTASLTGVPEAPRGKAAFTGWLQPAEGTGAVDDDPSDDVLPQLRIADALHHVSGDLYGAYAVAQPSTDAAEGTSTGSNTGTDGLERAELDQLPPSPRFTAIRNLFYAIEWWFFAAFAVFMWWRWLRDDVLGDEADDLQDDRV